MEFWRVEAHEAAAAKDSVRRVFYNKSHSVRLANGVDVVESQFERYDVASKGHVNPPEFRRLSHPESISQGHGVGMAEMTLVGL